MVYGKYRFGLHKKRFEQILCEKPKQITDNRYIISYIV